MNRRTAVCVVSALFVFWGVLYLINKEEMEIRRIELHLRTSRNIVEKRAAIEKLANMKTERAFRVLFLYYCMEIERVVSGVGGPPAGPPVDFIVKTQLAEPLLAAIKVAGVRCLELVERALMYGNRSERIAGAHVLRVLPICDELKIELINRVLESNDNLEIKEAAAFVLGGIGEQTERAVDVLLSIHDEGVRRAVAYSLLEILESQRWISRARDTLVEMYSSGGETSYSATAYSTSEAFCEVDIVELLDRIVGEKETIEFRGLAYPFFSRRIAELSEALDSEDSSVRLRAVRVLAALTRSWNRREEVSSRLERASSDKNVQVRRIAEAALRALAKD